MLASMQAILRYNARHIADHVKLHVLESLSSLRKATTPPSPLAERAIAASSTGRGRSMASTQVRALGATTTTDSGPAAPNANEQQEGEPADVCGRGAASSGLIAIL